MELNFEPFDSSSGLEQQRELFDECFPENTGTTVQSAAHYNWKFHSGPFTPNSYEYVARAAGHEIIGYYAALPYPYSIHGVKTPVAMVCDVMTGVKARGKGVFTRLGDFSTRQLSDAGLPFSTGYPIREEVIPGHLKVGWKIAFRLPLYVKFLRVDHLSFLKKIPLLCSCLNSFLTFLSFLRNSATKKYHARVYDETQVDLIDGYDDFIGAWYDGVPNHLLKTREFLKWRLGAPGKKYSIIAIESHRPDVNKTIRAIAITAFTVKEGIPCLAVLDFMTTERSGKYCHALHSEVEKLAKKTGAEAILTMISRTGSKKTRLFRNGFFKSPYSFSLIIKKLTDKFTDAQLYDPLNWSLMWIDSDDL